MSKRRGRPETVQKRCQICKEAAEFLPAESRCKKGHKIECLCKVCDTWYEGRNKNCKCKNMGLQENSDAEEVNNASEEVVASSSKRRKYKQKQVGATAEMGVPAASTEFTHLFEDTNLNESFYITVKGAAKTYSIQISNQRTRVSYFAYIENASLSFTKIEVALEDPKNTVYVPSICLAQNDQVLKFKIAEPLAKEEHELELRRQELTESELMKLRVKELEDEIETLKNKTVAFRHVGESSHIVITGETWQTVTAATTDIPLNLHDRPLKITINVSVITNSGHGGVRFILKNTDTGSEKIIGENPTYGLDWVSAQARSWNKNTILRVITGIPAGKYVATLQARAESAGATLQFHAGNESQGYSGIFILFEEL